MTEQKKLTGKCKGFRTLKDGQSVEYELSTREDGRTKASNVTVIEDKKPDIRHACAVVLTPDGVKPVL